MNALRQHIEAKFSQSVLETSPFPHLIIENFFPDETYQNILRYNPFKTNKGKEWLEASNAKNLTSKTPYHARKQINFHENDGFDAPPEQQKFWKDINHCFLSDDWFERLVFSKYRDYFSLRFGDLTHEPDFFSLFSKELFLQQHEPGYYIGPHTDIPTRIFTCIFSFADQEGFEEYGTQLMAHKDRLVRCWGCDHYPPEDFVVKKIAPYKPNNFLLFFKTRHSFHSVRSITDEVPNHRYGMQFQFWEQKDGLLRDLSVPDLMHFKNAQGAKTGRIKQWLKMMGQ